jgi:hypothetical protein
MKDARRNRANWLNTLTASLRRETLRQELSTGVVKSLTTAEAQPIGFLKHSQLQGIFWPLAHANRSSISNSCISPQPSTSLGRRRSTNLVSFVLRVRFTISTLKQHANVLNSKLGHRMSRYLAIFLRHRVDLLRLLLLQDFLLPGEFLSPLSRTRLTNQQRPQCLMTTPKER